MEMRVDPNCDIFKSGCEVLVNPVNCRGVMGKGLALQFKNWSPYLFEQYKKYCDAGKMFPGSIQAVELPGGPTVFNVATKDDWRQPSSLYIVERCIISLRDAINEGCFSSIAIPWLGCGCGGLNIRDVSRLYDYWFGSITRNVTILVVGK